MNTLEKAQRQVAINSIFEGANAAVEKGVPDQVVLDQLVCMAMEMIAAAHGGLSGLAEWHRKEAKGLEARIAAMN